MSCCHSALNVFSGSIPSVFGNGLLGTCVTGLVRVPSFLSTLTAVSMAGELTIRGLSAVLSIAGIQPAKDTCIEKFASAISNTGIRPYKEMCLKKLVLSAVAFAALGIVGSEFVRVAGGTAPAIYNNVLAFMGPIRIDTASYFDVLSPVLSRLGC